MTRPMAWSTAGLRSSNSGATSSESRSTPRDELGQVIGADREPVEERGELVGEDGVEGNSAHHVHLEPVVAASEPVGAQQLEHPPSLLEASGKMGSSA